MAVVFTEEQQDVKSQTIKLNKTKEKATQIAFNCCCLRQAPEMKNVAI